MSKWPASWRIILILVVAVAGALTGCLPMTDTPLDEEKDPNFIDGRNHQNMMDYKGAIECFERAVQSNPRNAAAHFELGVLYQQRMNDPVSAIYHYQKHLQLRPKSDYTEIIKPLITTCKLDIAKTVTFGVVTAEVHRDLGRLTNEIALVRQQNETLRAQLAAKPMVLTQWQTLRVTNTVVITNQPAPTLVVADAPRPAPAAPHTNATRRAEQPRSVTPLPQPRTGPTVPSTRASQFATPTPRPVRTYTVRSGDTFAEIARRSGISVDRLRAANPSIQPNRLKPGQILNLPTQ